MAIAGRRGAADGLDVPGEAAGVGTGLEDLELLAVARAGDDDRSEAVDAGRIGVRRRIVDREDQRVAGVDLLGWGEVGAALECCLPGGAQRDRGRTGGRAAHRRLRGEQLGARSAVEPIGGERGAWRQDDGEIDAVRGEAEVLRRLVPLDLRDVGDGPHRLGRRPAHGGERREREQGRAEDARQRPGKAGERSHGCWGGEGAARPKHEPLPRPVPQLIVTRNIKVLVAPAAMSLRVPVTFLFVVS